MLLRAVLQAAQDRSLIGGVDLDAQVVHSAGFEAFLEPGCDVLDLGSGGGLPGLVLAVGRPDIQMTLLDAARRRVRFLEWAIDQLGVGDRVDAVWSRAESAGNKPGMRERYAHVVSRSFGPPAVTAECARPLLADGGSLVVSEPPGSAGSEDPTRDADPRAGQVRWPDTGLAALGYRPASHVRRSGSMFVELVAAGACPAGLPRREGMPAKRPAF